MTTEFPRRTFLQGAAATAGLLGSDWIRAARAAQADTTFTSRWDQVADRPWLGEDYWANPLQDWRVASGRIECLQKGPQRNVQLLTRQLGPRPGTLRMSVRIGCLDASPLGRGMGSAGFRIGIMGPLREYRNSLIFGQGLDAGFTRQGLLFIGTPAAGAACELPGDQLELRLTIEPEGTDGATSTVTLAALDAQGNELGQVARRHVASEQLEGNLGLVQNFSGGEGPGPAKKQAKKQAAGGSGLGQFWFADWQAAGSRLESHPDRRFGPILFTQYTLSRGVLKLTAQLAPLGEAESQTVRLQLKRNQKWETVQEQPIDPAARTATFRIEDWDAAREVEYRAEYASAPSGAEVHHWAGTIRRDPVDQPQLTVADISCNIHEAFPNAGYTACVAQLNPDLLAFVGDQFYESTGGFGVQRAPLEPAILDYLRKWYLHGWTWRDLTRDRPSISIPDDHDVYQGNIWGEGGAAQTGTQEQGGYNMPAAWVNVVHRTQTSHHPDAWDPTPCRQGISVYAGPLVYGRVSFAILADRQFKSAPEGKVPPTGGRGDHVTDPNFDPKTADLPGLQLLGPRQMEFLREWVRDWRGADMKAVISQTIFTAMATTHGSPDGRLVADYDTNGWPQSERNAALREIRKAFAFHLAGDQHLPALIYYGIEAHGDAGLAFAGPAVNTGYPRWFEPLQPGARRAPGAPEITGDFVDSFGNPLTVLAVANGSKRPRPQVLDKLRDKTSGLGVVRFDKPQRRITVECWPFLVDPTGSENQFAGWPRTFEMLENYGREPVAHLPRLEIRGVESPLIEVFDESTGELVYGLRPAQANWQPHVFAPGAYTVRISQPESAQEREIRGLAARSPNDEVLEVRL